PTRGSATTSLAVVLLVAAEGPRRGELSELVADHRLGHEDRDVLAAVVHGEGVSQEVGGDHRPAGPGLDDRLGALLVVGVHLLLKVVVHEGALLQAAWHLSGSFSALLVLAATAATDDELVARLVRPAGPALGLTPRAHRVTSTGRLALTATVRVVDRVHRDTADGGALAL